MQINVSSHIEKVVRVAGRAVEYAEAANLLQRPDVNIAVGYLVYVESGGRTFLPWSCRP